MPCLPFRACHFALLLVCAPLCAADPIPWNTNTQGNFITCLCRDLRGHVWVGTEDGQGLWSYDPTAKLWTHFPASPDLSGDIYALACDKAGRIWAGGMSGVSVYNGRQWRQYGPTDGPLGSRLFALAVSPKDGGVWGATEAGLFRYQNNAWRYFTRAEGLPSDQASSLAFAADGTLFVGTQCDGVAVGSPDDDYKTWRVTSGPSTLPNAPAGRGLPSALINCLLVAHDGTVYAGTDGGLASSVDYGDTWHYVRGLDWKAKLDGLLHPVAAAPGPVPATLLREDYVTSLAEDADGRMWVGHRQTGMEAFAPKTLLRSSATTGATATDFVTALLPDSGGLWVGRYGGGLLPPAASAAVPASEQDAPVPALPVPAAPPTLAQLQAMLSRVQGLKEEMPIGGGAYLGEDWTTQGDWTGHYGRKFAVLCAARSPLNHDIQMETPYYAQGKMGPHHNPGDGIRNYCSWIKTDNPKSLYDPIPGYRRQAEWEDHGETYSRSFAGPDIWVSVTVPEGIQRVSFYFVNKDGHDGDNSNRDYTIELKAYQENLEAADALPALAQARISNFWSGVYKSFVVRGPSKYWIKIGKNNSKNTIVSAVLIDRLKGPATKRDSWALGWMGGVHYDPPNPDAPIIPDPHLLDKLLAAEASNIAMPVKTASQLRLDKQEASNTASASLLWSALNEAYEGQDSTALQKAYRLFAYRSTTAMNASEALQTNWRWLLQIWLPADREEFKQVMTKAHSRLLELNPQMQGLDY